MFDIGGGRIFSVTYIHVYISVHMPVFYVCKIQ